MEQKKLKHKRRTYELTIEIPGKGDKPAVIKKLRFRDIDSIHASAHVMQLFGRKKIKVLSAVVVKEGEIGRTD